MNLLFILSINSIRNWTFVLYIFMLLFPKSGQCSIISGRVIDESNKRPLRFVNVIHIEKQIGVMTNDSGVFIMHFDFNPDRSDSILFTLVGYKAKIYCLIDLIDTLNKNAIVSLMENPIVLQESVINTTRSKLLTLGNTFKNINQAADCQELFEVYNKIFTATSDSNDLHIEFGTFFHLNKKEDYELRFFEFASCISKLDSIQIRINVYSDLDSIINYGMSREVKRYRNLMQGPYYYTMKNSQGINKIDLTPLHIKIKKDFIITIETLGHNDFKILKIPSFLTLGRGSKMMVNTCSHSSFWQQPFMILPMKAILAY